jgi:hypothetical protein
MNIPLAAILGMCLLSPWPHAIVRYSAPMTAEWQSTQPEEKHPSESPQGSSAQTPSDQQKASDQSPAPPQPPCAANSQPGSTAKTDCKLAESNASKTRKRHRTHKSAAPTGTPADTSPTKTVVSNGGTDEPTINLTPGPSPKASQQRESTKELLATSEANLKKISARQLTANQQDTVKQIKSYIEQAETAANGGDVQRAYNLAVKANLLSAELAGH